MQTIEFFWFKEKPGDFLEKGNFLEASRASLGNWERLLNEAINRWLDLSPESLSQIENIANSILEKLKEINN